MSVGPGARAALMLRMGGVASATLARTLLRRVRKGPLIGSWSARVELLVEIQRAALGASLASDPELLQSGVDRPLLPLSPEAKAVPSRSVQGGPVPGAWIGSGALGAASTVLYLHGGGYVIGSVETHREVTHRLARDSEARVFAADYRLAPRHPFPAALEDAVSAYRWLLETGCRPEALAVAGDSAGGGLALALLQRLRDDGEPLPAAAALISPWVDLSCSTKSVDANAATDALDGAMVRTWSALYRNGVDAQHPGVSPLRGDLSGLPPLLIHVGAVETLRDEGEELAARAREAGVDVQLQVYDDMFHDWHLYARWVPAGARAIEEIARFIRQRTHG